MSETTTYPPPPLSESDEKAESVYSGVGLRPAVTTGEDDTSRQHYIQRVVQGATTEGQQHYGAVDPGASGGGGQRASRRPGKESGGGWGGQGRPRFFGRGQPLASHAENHRGPVQRHQGVDSRPRQRGAPIPPPSQKKTPQGAGKVRKELADRFYQLLSDTRRRRPILGKWGRPLATSVGGVVAAADAPPPFHQMPTLDAGDHTNVEEG